MAKPKGKNNACGHRFLEKMVNLQTPMNNILVNQKTMKWLVSFLSMMCVLIAVDAQEVSNSVGGNVFSVNMPQEKVYLHFDNTGYFSGETIRFKSYVVRTDNGTLTDLSKVLYVELLTPGGDVIATRKCAIIDGQANGDIKLDKILFSGFYEVRAYTRYMTNWGTSACFSRVFPIFDAPKTDGDYSDRTLEQQPASVPQRTGGSADAAGEQPVKRNANSRWNVRLFPEGGRLVRGVEGVVAFQIDGYDVPDADDDLATPVSACLVSSEGIVLEDGISVDMFGRGMFSVTPDGTELELRVTDRKGKDVKATLPQASEEGLALTVNAVSGKNITASVVGSPAFRGMKLGMLLQHTGTAIATDTFTVGDGAQTLALPREQMPAGVNVLSIFDGAGTVLADRMIFVAPKAEPSDSIRIVSNTDFLRPCGKVELELTALPNTTFSFSAMDLATMPNGKEGNAKTWMLLSSELRGYISNPDYYFEADDMEHRRAADLLMMVQGWRKYEVPEVKQLQPVEDKLYLFGQLKQAKKKQGVADVDLSVYLYNKAGETLKGETRTDSVGNYQFALPDCNGEWNMLMYTKKDEKNVKYYVGIDRHFSPQPRFIGESERMLLGLNVSNLFVAARDNVDDDVFIPLDKRVKVLPQIKVKGQRIYDRAREAWESERAGELSSQLYYNCDLESDKISDNGEEAPGFYDWLVLRNPLFGGSKADMENSAALMVENSTVESVEGADDEVHVVGEVYITDTVRQGLTYANRPIVWILNNDYYMTTSSVERTIKATYIPVHSKAEELPTFLDEAKSVYVCDDVTVLKRYIMSSDLEILKPVVVFVYTHNKFFRNVKGLRRTHYQGYDVAGVFQMEDYSILPPMEDFRRTIFWEPNVKTDSEGRAKIEFYNNSSCKEMFISAEGITQDGRYMVNE